MKRIKYFGAAALLTLLAACSNDDMENISYHDDPLAVHITATAGKNVITRSNPTEDTKQTAFNDNDRISIAAGDQAAVTYTKSGNDWNPASGSYLKWTTSTLTFNAYYPVDENNASMTTFDVPADQSLIDAIKNADYMTYTGDVAKPASATGTININIEMERQMARVVIGKIEFLDQYATGYSVTAIMVHGNTSGYESGAVKNGTVNVSSYKATDGKFYALLSPTTEASASDFLTITVKADNATETDPGTPLTVKGIPALTASNSYTYTLTVGKDMVAVSSVTVKEWADGGTVIEGEGDAEEKRGPDASTNTIYTSEAGQIASSPDWITTAIGGGKKLEIAGPMNEDDFAVIRSYMEQHNKDEGAELNIDISKTGLTALPKDAFANKDQDVGTGYHANNILRSVVLPEGLVSIGDYAFHFCNNLTRIDLPASLRSIGNSAFDSSQYQGAGLEELTIPDGVTYVGDSFLSRTNITRLTIPASLTSFTAGGEFCYIRKLQSLIFKGNVTEVGYMTFAYSEALTSIDLSKCEQVPTVRSSDLLFDGIDNPENIRITVPADLKSDFEAADGWKNATIVAAE